MQIGDSRSVPRFHKYKDLIYFLLRTQIVQYYKQTLVGPLWAVVEPVLSMVVFTFLFGKVSEINVAEASIPYPVYLYAGMLPWNFMRTAVVKAGNALVSNRNLVQRIYFPREILVLIPILGSAFDFLIAFTILIVLMVVYAVAFQPTILLLPVVMVGIALLSYGLGLILSAMNARYRDVTQGLPYIIQIWMYLSPVIYPPEFVTGPLQVLTQLNPMTGYLMTARGLILGTEWDWLSLGVSVAITCMVLVAGHLYFPRAEKSFVDTI